MYKITKSKLIFNKIKNFNTLRHIYRYKTLYKIYNKIFILTYNNPIKNVNYIIDDDGYMVAEIKNTDRKTIKERIYLHLQLLRNIKNNNVEHEQTIIETESSQLNIFSNYSAL